MAVGLTVGFAVGLAVGTAVGVAVGVAVGSAVGMAVGSTEVLPDKLSDETMFPICETVASSMLLCDVVSFENDDDEENIEERKKLLPDLIANRAPNIITIKVDRARIKRIGFGFKNLRMMVPL